MKKLLLLVTFSLLGALATPARSAVATELVGISANGFQATLWDINTVTGVPTNPRSVSAAPDRGPLTISFAPSGTLYGASQGSLSGIPAGGKLYTINPISGAATFVANLTQSLGVEGDIAVDPTTGILYAVSGVGLMVTINTTNGVMTTVGNLPTDLPGGADYSGMAFRNSGELFVWSTFGDALRQVNKSNATVISTVTLSPSPGGAIGGMSFDPVTGAAYIGAGSGSGAKLSTVNTTSGAVTSVGPLTGMDGVWGISFVRRPSSAIPTGNPLTLVLMGLAICFLGYRRIKAHALP